MVRRNQVTRNLETRTYICHSCNDRNFPIGAGLLEHCRLSPFHRDEWCERCQWLVIDQQSFNYHVHASSAHAICSFCRRDFYNQHELSSYEVQSHRYCSQCRITTREHDFIEHRINEHNRCQDCGSEFANRNELIRVSSILLVKVKRNLN